MPTPNNPAGRLYRILETALKHTPNNIPARAVWAELFKVDPTNTSEILYHVADLIGQLRLTREKIEVLDNIDQELHLTYIARLEQAFSKTTNFDAPWTHFQQQIPADVMTGLAFTSETLSRHRVEEEIEQASLDSLLSDIDAFLLDVVNSDIPPELKAVIIENLENIRRTIIQYKIRGAEGIMVGIEQAIGALLRHRDALVAEKNKTILLQRLWPLLAKVDQLVATAVKAKQLFATILKFFNDSDETPQIADESQ